MPVQLDGHVTGGRWFGVPKSTTTTRRGPGRPDETTPQTRRDVTPPWTCFVAWTPPTPLCQNCPTNLASIGPQAKTIAQPRVRAWVSMAASRPTNRGRDPKPRATPRPLTTPMQAAPPDWTPNWASTKLSNQRPLGRSAPNPAPSRLKAGVPAPMWRGLPTECRPTFRVGEPAQTGPPKARGAELQAMIPSRHSCALRLEVGRPRLFPSPAMLGFHATQDFPRFGLQVPIPSPHGSPKAPSKTHANSHPMSAGFPTMHPRYMTQEPASAGENRGRAFGLRVGCQIPTQGRPSISPGCAMFFVLPHRKGNRLVLRFSAHFTPAT